jgi:hypothetical protein
MFDDILGKDERVKPVIDGKLGNVKPASVGGVNGPDGMNPNKKDPKDPTAISKPSIFDAVMDDDPVLQILGTHDYPATPDSEWTIIHDSVSTSETRVSVPIPPKQLPMQQGQWWLIYQKVIQINILVYLI